MRLGKQGILNPRMKGHALIPFLVENQALATAADLPKLSPQQAKD